MAKKIIDFESTCEGCGKPVKMSREVDIPDAPTLDQIHSTLNEALKGKQGISSDEVKQLLQEQLSPLQPKEDHRHKTADELLDCPECRPWFDKTTQKYQVGLKEGKEPKQPVFEFGGLRPKESE